MKAIILAAGEGRRMRPLTYHIPKPLLKIKEEPLLAHIIKSLPKEVGEIVLVIGYLGDKIASHFGSDFGGRKINYIRQNKPTGTFSALKLCQSFIKPGERFFALYADDLHGEEGIKNCLQHEQAILTAEVEDPKRFGVISLNEDNSVFDIIEKPETPPSNLISSGVFVFNDKIFNYQPKKHSNGEYYLAAAVSDMAKEHKIYTARSSFWLPIGYPEDLVRASEALMS